MGRTIGISLALSFILRYWLFRSWRILVPIRGYTHRFQKLIHTSVRFPFPPASLWEFQRIDFRIHEVFRIRSWSSLWGAIKAAAVVDDIIAFFTAAGLLYRVGVFSWGLWNLSRLGDRTLVLKFGQVGVWLVVTEICDAILNL